MNIPKEALIAIFESIEVHKGMDLLVKKNYDTKTISDYLHDLEEEDYINIHLKFFTDKNKLLYSNLSLTEKGVNLYISLLTEIQAGFTL